jgi:uncharacterized protein YlxW (UPF0749 family)
MYAMAKPRLSRANAVVTVLALGLGFAIAAQLHTTRAQPLETLREDELVRVLDDVTQNNERLGTELRELERTRDALEGGASNSAAAIAAARERAETLGILAGTLPASGPGVRITISDPAGEIPASLILDAVQELRDAGAEAIQIGAVRVVAGTWFTDASDGISVSGTTVHAPYDIEAIGDPTTIATAMDIPGGVVASVRGKGGETNIASLDTVRITATVTPAAPRFATAQPSGK